MRVADKIELDVRVERELRILSKPVVSTPMTTAALRIARGLCWTAPPASLLEDGIPCFTVASIPLHTLAPKFFAQADMSRPEEDPAMFRRYAAAVALSALFVMDASAADSPEATATEQASEEPCETTAFGSDPCVLYDYRKLDLRLNTLYKRQMALLRGSVDEKRLLDAQRAWLKYTEADCLYQVGTEEGPAEARTLDQNRCMSAHLEQRIDKLKSFLACASEDCNSEADLAPLPTEVNTLRVGRRTVMHSGGDVFRKRKTGALVRLKEGEAVEPGDLLLFRSGGGSRVNGDYIVGGDGPHWMRIR